MLLFEKVSLFGERSATSKLVLFRQKIPPLTSTLESKQGKIERGRERCLAHWDLAQKGKVYREWGPVMSFRALKHGDSVHSRSLVCAAFLLSEGSP